MENETVWINFSIRNILKKVLVETQPETVRSSHPEVLLKRCSENMQQIYRRTLMSKCDVNKVATQFYWNRTAWVQSNFIKIALWHGCSPVNLLHIFRKPFPKNTTRWLLLNCCHRFSFLTSRWKKSMETK